MNKNVFNLLLIIVILNSFYNVLIQFIQPPLCPLNGPNYKPKCRFYILASDKTDCDDPQGFVFPTVIFEGCL